MSVSDDLKEKLRQLAPDLVPVLDQPDAGAKLMEILPKKYTPVQAAGGEELKTWDTSGLFLQSTGRYHEALAVHWGITGICYPASLDQRVFTKAFRWFASATVFGQSAFLFIPSAI